MIVGRYWAIEVVIFQVVAIFATGCVLVLALKWLTVALAEEQAIPPDEFQRRLEEKQREIKETESRAAWARFQKMQEESRARFNALPEIERNRILEETRWQHRCFRSFRIFKCLFDFRGCESEKYRGFEYFQSWRRERILLRHSSSP